MKIVTYTAAIGILDRPRQDVLCVEDVNKSFSNPRRNARMIKILSHLFVDANISVWIDANIELLVKPELLVEMMGEHDVACFRHCERSDIYQEAAACMKMNKDTAANILPQVERYRMAGYAKHDLGMTFILVRRHTEQVRRRNERWFAELTRYSVRDQISFPVVFDGLVNYWEPVPLTRSKFFIRHPHGTYEA